MTVIVVEQSVNVALTLAERAVFMEKGTVRFVGPTRELLERPDLLRSVFIEGAGSGGDDEVHDQADEVLAKIDLSRLADQELTEVAPTSDEPVLVCRNVTKRFGGVHALSDVDLIVGPGEVVGPHRPERRRQDHADGLHLRVPPLDAGIHHVPRHRHLRLGAPPAGAEAGWAGRSRRLVSSRPSPWPRRSRSRANVTSRTVP